MSYSKLYEIYCECNTELSARNSRLIGKILTLADSAFSDPQQRKAFKDIARQIMEEAFYADSRDIVVEKFKKVATLNGEVLFADSPLTNS